MKRPVLNSAQKLRLLDLFKAALELDKEERMDFVRDACSNDPTLAAELGEMLTRSASDSDDEISGETTQ